MKKKTFLVMVLLVGAIMVAFCGGSSEKGNKSVSGAFSVPENGYDGSEVTLTFYHTIGSTKTHTLDDAIAAFNELYPNIHIVYESVGGYDDLRDQISTQIPVGNEPDLAYCYPDHVALYNLAGVVATLDNLIDSNIVVTRADGTTEILGLTQEQKDDFIEGYYEEGRQFGDGLMYTMPFSKSTEVFYYNKTFFDENGLSVPTTWEELEAVCAKIKEIDPTSFPLGYDSESNWFITMCEQYNSPYTSATGEHYLFNNETNRAFIKLFRSWYEKGYLTTQKLYGAYTSGLFTSSTSPRSYMSIGSSAGATYQRPTKVDGVYPFEVGIASIPQVSQSNRKVISQGPSLVIFNKGDSQKIVAAWLFVKYLTTNVAFQAAWSMDSGYVPVIKSVANDPTYAAFLASADGYDNIAALSAKACLAQEDAYYTSPAFNGSSAARDQVGALLSKCLSVATDNVDAMILKAFEDAIEECEYNN